MRAMQAALLRASSASTSSASTSQLPAATFPPTAGPPPPPCRFRFGAFFRGADTPVEPHDYGGIDYVSAWIGQRDAMSCSQPPCFNPYWHGAMLQLARERGLSVAYYAYIVAFLAKATGLHDCDVGEPSLCQRGAMYIREHRHLILRTYARFANETAKILGRSAEVLFLMCARHPPLAAATRPAPLAHASSPLAPPAHCGVAGSRIGTSTTPTRRRAAGCAPTRWSSSSS